MVAARSRSRMRFSLGALLFVNVPIFAAGRNTIENFTANSPGDLA